MFFSPLQSSVLPRARARMSRVAHYRQSTEEDEGFASYAKGLFTPLPPPTEIGTVLCVYYAHWFLQIRSSARSSSKPDTARALSDCQHLFCPTHPLKNAGDDDKDCSLCNVWTRGKKSLSALRFLSPTAFLPFFEFSFLSLIPLFLPPLPETPPMLIVSDCEGSPLCASVCV